MLWKGWKRWRQRRGNSEASEMAESSFRKQGLPLHTLFLGQYRDRWRTEGIRTDSEWGAGFVTRRPEVALMIFTNLSLNVGAQVLWGHSQSPWEAKAASGQPFQTGVGLDFHNLTMTWTGKSLQSLSIQHNLQIPGLRQSSQHCESILTGSLLLWSLS